MELKVSLIQPNTIWEDKSANREKITEMIRYLKSPDLIILPETFTTGFSMNVERLAESMDGPTIRWMQEISGNSGAAITGSIIIKESDYFFNRLVFVAPGQPLVWYDKHHLFTMGEEHLYFSPGNQRVTVHFNGWKIRLLICYDLRFPVWSRNNDDYDLLVYVACWPSPRHHVWKNLLVARAVENQCYCIGVNQVGTDGVGLNYPGDSVMVTPRGEATWLGNQETSETFSLSLTSLHEFRKKFPLLHDRDNFFIM